MKIVGPSFSSTFYGRFCDPTSLQTPQTLEKKPVLFSDAKNQGQTMDEFMKGLDFEICQEEYVMLLDGIVKFAQENMNKVNPELLSAEVVKIQEGFTLLKNHLSDLKDDYFSTHKPIVYGPLKEMFHELENLLKNESIPLQKRVDTIKMMVPHMTADCLFRWY